MHAAKTRVSRKREATNGVGGDERTASGSALELATESATSCGRERARSFRGAPPSAKCRRTMATASSGQKEAGADARASGAPIRVDDSSVYVRFSYVLARAQNQCIRLEYCQGTPRSTLSLETILAAGSQLVATVLGTGTNQAN